jgi:hypothetical protein
MARVSAPAVVATVLLLVMLAAVALFDARSDPEPFPGMQPSVPSPSPSPDPAGAGP